MILVLLHSQSAVGFWYLIFYQLKQPLLNPLRFNKLIMFLNNPSLGYNNCITMIYWLILQKYILQFFNVIIGNHHSEFDHEAIIGSHKEAEEYDHLPPEEAKRRLGILLTKMDLSKDGFIDRKELKAWIIRSFKQAN